MRPPRCLTGNLVRSEWESNQVEHGVASSAQRHRIEEQYAGGWLGTAPLRRWADTSIAGTCEHGQRAVYGGGLVVEVEAEVGTSVRQTLANQTSGSTEANIWFVSGELSRSTPTHAGSVVMVVW